MTHKNKTIPKISKILEFTTMMLFVITIIQGLAFCALFVELGSFKESILETRYTTKILSDLEEEALVTIPVYYTKEYEDNLLRKGVYSIEEPRPIKVKRKELYKYQGIFKIIDENAYMFEGKHVLSVLLNEEYNGDHQQLEEGIERYKTESVYILKNKAMNSFGLNTIILLLLAIISFYLYDHV